MGNPTGFIEIQRKKHPTRPVAEGLDPDGDVVWTRILEVTGG